MIRSFTEDGFDWVEVPDELWRHAIFTDYMNGFAMDFKRR